MTNPQHSPSSAKTTEDRDETETVVERLRQAGCKAVTKAGPCAVSCDECRWFVLAILRELRGLCIVADRAMAESIPGVNVGKMCIARQAMIDAIIKEYENAKG